MAADRRYGRDMCDAWLWYVYCGACVKGMVWRRLQPCKQLLPPSSYVARVIACTLLPGMLFVWTAAASAAAGMV